MASETLSILLHQVAEGKISPDEALAHFGSTSIAELGYASVDLDRKARTGIAEVIYGENKEPEQIAGIVRAMQQAGQTQVIVTRLAPEKAAALVSDGLELDYRDICRIGLVGGIPDVNGNGTIVVAAAGTSDLPVAEEAAVVAEALGNTVQRLYDVGVAGIHRLLSHTHDVQQAQVIIAVAGMEGALPSVVAGLVSCPVIAVPTSVGYGASFGGVTALLAMLNSCASGVSVVNIDNGFGAAYQASQINHLNIERNTL